MEDQVWQKSKTTTKYKLKDILNILNIYKNSIEEKKDDELLEININKNLKDKQSWLNKRITNNRNILNEVYKNYEYYKTNINSQIENNGETKKLVIVRNKMNEYFQNEILFIENRIKHLSDKMKILEYFLYLLLFFQL